MPVPRLRRVRESLETLVLPWSGSGGHLPYGIGAQRLSLAAPKGGVAGAVLPDCFNALLSERRARERDRDESPSRVFDANYQPARPIPTEGEFSWPKDSCYPMLPPSLRRSTRGSKSSRRCSCEDRARIPDRVSGRHRSRRLHAGPPQLVRAVRRTRRGRAPDDLGRRSGAATTRKLSPSGSG